jgi:hypothetical protein
MSFTEAGRKIIEGVAAGLYEGGTIIMAQSQILVPVEFGTLKRSGHVEEPQLDDGGDRLTVTVGYGYGAAYAGRVAEQLAEDPDAEHAYGFWVHERVIVETYDGKPARHAGKPVFHKPPTQAKFLLVPARAFAPEFGAVLDAAVDARLAQP